MSSKQASKHASKQTRKQPNNQTTKQPNNQTTKQPNSQATEQPNNRTTNHPNNQTTKPTDKQSTESKERKERRERREERRGEEGRPGRKERNERKDCWWRALVLSPPAMLSSLNVRTPRLCSLVPLECLSVLAVVRREVRHRRSVASRGDSGRRPKNRARKSVAQSVWRGCCSGVVWPRPVPTRLVSCLVLVCVGSWCSPLVYGVLFFSFPFFPSWRAAVASTLLVRTLAFLAFPIPPVSPGHVSFLGSVVTRRAGEHEFLRPVARSYLGS